MISNIAIRLDPFDCWALRQKAVQRRLFSFGRSKTMRLSDFKNLIASMPVCFQAFTSKRATWASHIDGDNEAGQALRSMFGESDSVTLSRHDLRELASKPDLAQFVMATVIWGYPRGMRGNHVANLINYFGQLTQLLSTAREQSVTDWSAHYKAVGEIAGIGLSTYTKLLSFLSVQIHCHSALILDDRIIRVASRGIFEELMPVYSLSGYNAVRSYPQYLSCIHSLANNLAVSAEQIEFFLFEFGLNLKPLPAQQFVLADASQVALR